MTAFIRQEAMEKANEIRLKADEEFAIEKSKLVRQETASIDSSYEKKFKQASMSQQITRSTVANKSRLRILSARQELLNRLFEDASKKLGEVSKDKAKYQGIMKNFILEGAYALSEDKLQVKARKADYDVTKKAIEEAQKEYKTKVGKDVAITIDESDPLPEGS
jgi:V-type H+-transporting ATPase subunit E